MPTDRVIAEALDLSYHYLAVLSKVASHFLESPQLQVYSETQVRFSILTAIMGLDNQLLHEDFLMVKNAYFLKDFQW